MTTKKTIQNQNTKAPETVQKTDEGNFITKGNRVEIATGVAALATIAVAMFFSSPMVLMGLIILTALCLLTVIYKYVTKYHLVGRSWGWLRSLVCGKQTNAQAAPATA